MTPRNVSDVLQLLQTYHGRRRDSYLRMAKASEDARATLLLEHLVEIEEDALRVVADELQHLPAGRNAYLSSGPTLSHAPAHAMDCRCDEQPAYADALSCALSSDDALDELIDRLAGGSAAASVQELAERLRELERTKDRQIAKFARDD